MTEIKFDGYTYVGTTEGDQGVFTHSGGVGAGYAGKIACGSACVGVFTWGSRITVFVECDANGQWHGRVLDCYAGGDTAYCLMEHGSAKEEAVLRADGTCKYDGKACRADYAPFAALQAMVVPIKARPSTSAPTAAFLFAAFFRPHRPPIGPIGHVLALAGTGDDPRRQGARPTPPSACVGLVAQQLPNKCTARPTQTTHRRKGALCMRHKRMRSAPFRRLCARSEPPCASAFPITCRTPSGSVAVCGGLHV
jgi:hypothetical protein